jgi:hypothetical protein
MFFVPRPLIRQAFMFILATAARRYNIGIVAYAMMPTHLHIIVNPGEDPTRDFDLPGFKQFLNSNLARFVNYYWGGRKGHVFCRDSVGDSIRIVDAPTEAQQIIYAELNPIVEGMGHRPEALDGVTSLRKWLTLPKVVKRPPVFFQERSWREEETLRLCVPKLYQKLGYSPAEFQKLTQDRLNREIKKVHKRLKKQGKRIKSLRELEKAKPSFTPGHSSADHSRAWMVGQDREEKAKEYHNLEAFWAWHEDSLERAKAGEEDVVFPPGTYRAAKKYGCRVASKEYFEAKVRRRDRSQLNDKYERKLRCDEARVERLE